jgi:uncharacterized membrane protein
MGTCWKCGALLKEGEEFCSSCGLRLTGFGKPGNRSELVKKLDDYRNLLDEYEYLVQTVKPVDNFPKEEEQTAFKRRSFFRYFWPFLIIATGLFYLIYLASSFVAVINQDEMGYLLGAFLGIIIVAVIIVFGYKVARRKQKDNNEKADDMSSLARERYNQGVANQKKLERLAQLEDKKIIMDPIVPEEYRDFDSVARIEELIMQNKAETIDEAIAIIKSN